MNEKIKYHPIKISLKEIKYRPTKISLKEQIKYNPIKISLCKTFVEMTKFIDKNEQNGIWDGEEQKRSRNAVDHG